MKYLKLYEELKNEISLEDFDKIKNWYCYIDEHFADMIGGVSNQHVLMTLVDIDISPLNKNPTKVYCYEIIYEDGSTYEAYYDTRDLKSLINSYSMNNSILRPATPKEIEEFEMKSNAKKYNL
jgi:hypothetical protein